MVHNQTTFSIIVPVWNRLKELQRAVESVLAQTYPNWELIIVDDCSDNFADTQEYIANLNNNKIKLLQLATHINASAARNMGIKAASGEWIAFLDSDDYFTENKLDVIAAQIGKCDDPKKTIFYSEFLSNNKKFPKRAIDDGESIGDYLFVAGGFIGTPSLVLSRKVVLDNLFNESCKKHQDYEFLLRLEDKGCKLKFIDQPLWVRSFRESSHNVGAIYNPKYSITWLYEHQRFLSSNAIDGFIYSHIVNSMLMQTRRKRLTSIFNILFSRKLSLHHATQILSTLLPYKAFCKIKAHYISKR